MAKAAMLFSGIGYSFEVVDTAFGWAKLSKGSLLAFFLRAKNEKDEGYIFPSDLDAAENLNTGQDSKDSHIVIFNSNIRQLEHAAAAESIKVQTIVLTDPEQEELLNMLEGCDCIFTSDDIHEVGTLTVDSINMKKFVEKSTIPVEIIKSQP